MVTHDVLKAFQIALAHGSCNLKNLLNITRVHKSRNTLAFMRTSAFPFVTLSLSLVKTNDLVFHVQSFRRESMGFQCND